MKVKKIIIIETSYIGDLTFLFPAFKSLKRNFPESEITLITTPGPAKAAKLLPYIDRVIKFDKRGNDKGINILKFIKKLPDERFDLLIAPHRFGSTRIIASRIKADLKIGYRFPLCSSIFHKCGSYDERLPVEFRISSLLQQVGVTLEQEDFDLRIREDEINRFRKRFGTLTGEPFVFIIPGSNWATKRWPAGHYARLGQWIHEKGYKVYAGGSPAEKEILTELKRLGKGKIEIIDSPLEDMLIFTYFSRLVIGNDTGPLHFARIFDKPVVAIFGPTPHNIFTWKEHQKPVYLRGLKCRPCNPHGPRHCPRGTLQCLFELKPEDIWREIKWLLERS